MSITTLQRICLALALIAIGLVFVPRAQAAANITCNTTGISTMAFGPVDPASSLTNTTATISFQCNNPNSSQGSAIVCYNFSGGAFPLNMTAGGNNLGFSVYTDSGRTITWGNTTSNWAVGPSPTPLLVPANSSANGSVTLYGQVTGGQTSAVAGNYSYTFAGSAVLITVSSKSGSGGLGTDCSTSVTAPQAATSVSFQATATVTPTCSVTGGTLDFGSKTGGTSVLNATGSTTFTVNCVSGRAYTIGMSPTGGATNGTGNMTNGTTTDTVAFALCQDSTACATAWGNVTSGGGANVKSGTGSGSAQTYTAYGKVTGSSPASGYVKPVTYSNTTTITVTY